MHVVRADVGQPDDLTRLVDEAAEALGGLDILIHNAASGYNRPVMEQRVKGWDWTLNINARAALFLAQRAAPILAGRGGGAIVNVSSIGAQRVLPEYVVVGTSKAALEYLTRYLAVELAPLRIVVNAVSAGMVRTDALQHFPGMREHFEERFAYALARTPAGQVLEPDDVAGVVAFLCSPDAFMIRGQTILIDGSFARLLRVPASFGRGERQADRHLSACAGGADQVNGAAVCLDDPFDQGQAQASALVVTGGALKLDQQIPDRRLLLLVNARSLVGHGQDGLRLRTVEQDSDGAARRGVLHGVAQHLADRGHQQVAQPGHASSLVAGRDVLHGDRVPVGNAVEQRQRIVHQKDQVQAGWRGSYLAGDLPAGNLGVEGCLLGQPVEALRAP